MPMERLEDHADLSGLSIRERWVFSPPEDEGVLLWANDGWVYWQTPSGIVTRAPEYDLLDDVYLGFTSRQTQILKQFCREMPPPVNAKHLERYTFWNSLVLDAVEPVCFDFDPPPDRWGNSAPPMQLRIDATGYQVWQRGSGRKRAFSRKHWRTLAATFFLGPCVKLLPLSLRRTLKQTLYGYLDSSTTLKLKDGFPLIEYEAVVDDRWDWEIERGEEGVILKGGIVTKHGWEGDYRNGFGRDYPLEEVFIDDWARGLPGDVVEELRSRALAARVEA